MKRNTLVMMFLVLLAFLPLATGQVPTGTPPFGSFGGGPFDIVNLGNLNVHFTIPIIQKAGRGSQYGYSLSYDTSVWYPVGGSGSQSWTHVPQFGLVLPPTVGWLTDNLEATFQQPCDPPSNMTMNTFYAYGQFVYREINGTSHSFSGSYTTPYIPGCQSGSQYPSTAAATDGSGYTITIGGSPFVSYVTGPDGTVYDFLSGFNSRTDTNGNQITESTSGTITDTLGQTALSTTGTNPLTLTYTAPSGASASYVVNYTPYNIKTNFGCSGITEYSANSVSLVSSIGLPDGTSYTFAYEPTPGNSGYTTGRLAQVTLPTGGSINYGYTGANDGINCADGSTLGLTRTLSSPGGEWSYARTQISGSHWQTTVTSPPDPVNTGSASDVTVIDFQQDGSVSSPTYNFYETQRKAYQGAATGTPLETLTTCYNANYANCPTTGVSTPITQTDQYSQLGTGATRLSEMLYNSNGLNIDDKEYTYGVATGTAPGTTDLIRETAVTYASLGNGIYNRPASVIVYDWSSGSKVTLSSSTYGYDQTAVTTTTGTPQHVSVTGSHGNLTTVTVSTSSTASLSKVFTYYDTGMLKTATDWGTTTSGGPNLTTLTYSSTASCGNSFPTSVAYPVSRITVSYTWNCIGGVLLTTTDPNSNVTTTDYTTDPHFWRPDFTLDQLQNKTTFAYTGQNVAESTLLFNSNNSVVDQRTKLDGFGRISLSETEEGPSSTAYDSTETDYDIMGRVAKNYIPFTNSGDADCSGACPGVVTTYDAMNRPLTVTDGGGGTITYTYTSNDVYQAVGPAPTGENAKRKQLEYDGLGRLSSVCEVTSVTGSSGCGQGVSQTGFRTSYTDDALGRVLQVVQNAKAAPSSRQTRTYTYDLAGRLLTETNPETGTITYTYDTADATCGSYSSPGDLVEKKDAMGNYTCTKYDALHRGTQTTYPSGSYASVTPTKCYVYDSATVNSQVMANAKARLAEAYTTSSASCPGTVTVDEGFSYSARGEMSDVWEKTPDSGGYYHVNATYWAHGRLNVLNGGTSPLPGLPAITYGASGTGLDGKGRITAVTAASGQNPVNSISWNGGNQITGVTFGSLDNDAYQYDPNTGRMTQYQFNMGTGPASQTGALTWNANGTLQTLQITDQINTANSQTCSYSHDDLTRIASANCGSAWSQTFSLDPFGNLSKSGSASFLPTYTGATGTGTTPSNQYYSIPGGSNGVSNYYDTNGNLKNDVTNTYTWDADGNMLSVNGTTVTMIYDALDRMAEQTRSTGHTEIVYGPYGMKLALMNGQTFVNAFVKLPGGSRAVYNSSGLAYYRHGDHLGNSRLATTPSRTKYYDVAYAPYGEDYNGSGTTPDLAFTDENQDTVGGGWAANLYDFMLREYRTAHGRWTSPDPAGLGVVDPTNPQTWNRYAYVLNNPLAMVDLLGDDGCYDQNMNTINCPNGVPPGTVIYPTQGTAPYPPTIVPGPTDNPDPNPPGSCVANCGQSGGGAPTQTGSGGGGNGWGGGAANNGLASSGAQPISKPKTPAQCSVYNDGSATGTALYTLCSKVFPNSPVSNQIRGCLQSFYTPGSGYAPIPVPLAPTTSVDLNEIVPGTGAHLVCFANAAGIL